MSETVIPKVRVLWQDEQQDAFRRVLRIVSQFNKRTQIEMADYLADLVRKEEPQSDKDFIKRLTTELEREKA
ncbi:MAG: hypothetical protein K1X54_11515 [Flavobacteriales bacterium]|nr:hypothetical protein [Flavobacteriales bacterium]